MCNTIIQVAKEGGHQAAMLVALDIRSKDTFNRWCKEFPEFGEAYEWSKVVSRAKWEDIGYKGATGQIDHFSASTYAIIMNNKFGDEYKRSGTGGHTEITVNNNTLNLSAEELQKKIEQTTARLKLLGDNVGNIKNSARIIEPSRTEGTTS